MGILTIALVLDLIVGDPDWVWRRAPHPVVLIGKIIDFFDAKRAVFSLKKGGDNSEEQRDLLAGCVLALILLIVSLVIFFLVQWVWSVAKPAGFILELLLVAALIAQKSLQQHVSQVVLALRTDGVEGGRKAVSIIVGRDVSKLNESGVCKAAIESLAENFSDGVVAPVFWYAVLGLPGIIFYKAINTADSMIGHRNEKYEYFGKCVAIIDDWMNWPAARLSSIITMAAVAIGQGSKAAQNVWHVTWRDAGGHRSPNAGWPETSYAVALGISLGGPRAYGNETVDAVVLNPDGREEAMENDVERALRLFLRCCLVLMGFCSLCWLFFS